MIVSTTGLSPVKLVWISMLALSSRPTVVERTERGGSRRWRRAGPGLEHATPPARVHDDRRPDRGRLREWGDSIDPLPHPHPTVAADANRDRHSPGGAGRRWESARHRSGAGVVRREPACAAWSSSCTATGTGQGTDDYFHLAPAADARGYVYAYPDGTIDSNGNQFWNATDACCNFNKAGVDDVAYLTSLIAEIRAKLAIDPKRIAFVGHSNGGFMTYRMACDQAGLVAAIVSLAGATFADRSDCAPSEPVSVAQIHGTADGAIHFKGGNLSDVTYPGAEMTAEAWATYNGCGETLTAQRQGRRRCEPERRSRSGRDVGRGVVGMQVKCGGPALVGPEGRSCTP